MIKGSGAAVLSTRRAPTEDPHERLPDLPPRSDRRDRARCLPGSRLHQDERAEDRANSRLFSPGGSIRGALSERGVGAGPVAAARIVQTAVLSVQRGSMRGAQSKRGWEPVRSRRLKLPNRRRVALCRCRRAVDVHSCTGGNRTGIPYRSNGICRAGVGGGAPTASPRHKRIASTPLGWAIGAV